MYLKVTSIASITSFGDFELIIHKEYNLSQHYKLVGRDFDQLAADAHRC